MTAAQASRPHILVVGLGYTGTALARAAVAEGLSVAATSRVPAATSAPEGVRVIAFDAAADALAQATHLVVTAAPDDAGDPTLAAYGEAVAAAPRLRWIGYLSTTGVYGDRDGGWVDDRARRRIAAEQAWASLAGRRSVDLCRVAGIYGPGRSAFDDLRAGRARRVSKPGHAFGRIHRDDIARALLAAIHQDHAPGLRVLHLADDEPAESQVVIAEAAALLGVEPPPLVPFAVAQAGMSPMARSFWADNRKVSSAKTRSLLGIDWHYPTYREGLRAILAEEGRDGLA
jgi:nucleoside-diphosphate-sugar epimerase